MSAAGAGARLELEQGMAAALELLARARGALARGDLPDLGRLIAMPAARSDRERRPAPRGSADSRRVHGPAASEPAGAAVGGAGTPMRARRAQLAGDARLPLAQVLGDDPGFVDQREERAPQAPVVGCSAALERRAGSPAALDHRQPSGRPGRRVADAEPAARPLAAGPATAQSLNIDLGDGGTGHRPAGPPGPADHGAEPGALDPGDGDLVHADRGGAAFLRSALGLQQTPPNPVLISLALFITAFVMAPTMEQAWRDGLAPLLAEEIGEFEAFEAFERATAPLRGFMLGQVRPKDLELFFDISGTPALARPEETPLHALIPAFMISELRCAFEMDFLIFVPFPGDRHGGRLGADVDGHEMLPPVLISLPFKLIFFVLVDG